MKLNFVTPSLALIIVAMGFFIAWQCQSAKVQRLERSQDNQIHQERVKVLQDKSAISEAVVKRLEQDRKIYTDSAKVQQRARLSEIKALQATAGKLEVKLAPIIQSNPDLSALISTKDLVIRKQSDLIDSLQLAHSAEIVNMTAQLEEKGNQISV